MSTSARSSFACFLLSAAMLAAGVTGLSAIALSTSAAAAALPSECTQNATSGLVTCVYTAVGEHSFAVPTDATEFEVTVIGAPGGANQASDHLNVDLRDPFTGLSNGLTRLIVPGGVGASVTRIFRATDFNVSTLYLEVGGAGRPGQLISDNVPPPTPGGENGGGNGGAAQFDENNFIAFGGGSGGGASDVRTINATQPGSQDTRLIVAAGGGGASATAPGGAAGASGTSSGVVLGAAGGDAATTSAAGVAHCNPQHNARDCSTAGTLGRGGDGGRMRGLTTGAEGGGGGGGGLYGGGGGTESASGGGGSSLVPAQGTITTVSIDTVASVTIRYLAALPPPTTPTVTPTATPTTPTVTPTATPTNPVTATPTTLPTTPSASPTKLDTIVVPVPRPPTTAAEPTPSTAATPIAADPDRSPESLANTGRGNLDDALVIALAAIACGLALATRRRRVDGL